MATQTADEMASKELLFEAITKIKKGHNKPNTARICSYLGRNYDLAPNRCIKAVNHFSSTGDIVVVNVGAPAADLSYRVAEQPSFDALAALKGSMINKFMAKLIINEPNYLTDGVPPDRLVSFVAQKEPQLTHAEILESIRAELSLGNLDTFENGNYGYFPLDSSDEDEPADKKQKPNSPSGKASLPVQAKSKVVPPPCVKLTPRPPPVVSKTNGTKPLVGARPIVGAKIGGAEKVSTVAETKRERKPVTRFEDKDDRKENKERQGDTGRRVEDQTVLAEEGREEGVRRRRLKKRKVYVGRDDTFQPGSKDFKVDLSLERQARKRKEKKIFDPSAEDSKTRRRGSAAVQGQTSAGATSLNTAAGKKLVSPGKKLLAGSSVKLGQGSGVQVPPGGRTSITPLVPSSVCYLCQMYGKRIKGVPEKLISCIKCCDRKAHISCLNAARSPTDKPLSTTAPVNDWVCVKCHWTSTTPEKCVYCNEFKAGIYILECIECKSGFHVPCHKSLIPPLAQQEPILPDKFKCVRCQSLLHRASEDQCLSPKESTPMENPKPVDPPRPIVVVKQTTPPLQQFKVNVTQVRPKVNDTQVRPKVNDTQVRPKVNDTQVRPKVIDTQVRPKVIDTQARPKVTSVAVGPDNDATQTCQSSSQPTPGFNNLSEPPPQYPIDPRVPDCQSWSSMDVYNYLRRFLLQDVCDRVLDADMDGKALLLMKKTDFVQELNLPLGSAIKLWSHVLQLQTKISDVEWLYESAASYL